MFSELLTVDFCRQHTASGRNLRPCLAEISSGMSVSTIQHGFFFVTVKLLLFGIQWFKVLGRSFLPGITSSTKHSSLLFPFILFKPFMPLISRACEALYIVVMPWPWAELAHARQSSSRLGSALASSQPCDTYSRSLKTPPFHNVGVWINSNIKNRCMYI